MSLLNLKIIEERDRILILERPGWLLILLDITLAISIFWGFTGLQDNKAKYPDSNPLLAVAIGLAVLFVVVGWPVWLKIEINTRDKIVRWKRTQFLIPLFGYIPFSEIQSVWFCTLITQGRIADFTAWVFFKLSSEKFSLFPSGSSETEILKRIATVCANNIGCPYKEETKEGSFTPSWDDI